MDLLGHLQFDLLPFGSPLLLAVGILLWLRRRRAGLRVAVALLACSAAASALLVACLYSMHRLPWAMPCLGCLASEEWYSFVLTFLQGWGFGSAVSLALWQVWRRWSKPGSDRQKAK